ncbi:MAG TPA: hypothetical protein VF026_25015 [Ktedonobacteraceae bacterium]
MPIDVDTGGCFLLSRRPQGCSPLPKGARESLSPSTIGEVGEKALGVPIAVGSASACPQAQGLVGVATQVSRSAQADRIEKE